MIESNAIRYPKCIIKATVAYWVNHCATMRANGCDSPWRSHIQNSLPPRAAGPTKHSIFPRSVNEYMIIPGLIIYS